MSKNNRQFLVSPKTFYAIKDQPKSSLNKFSKTEHMVTSAEQRPKPSGLRSEVSKFSGWVTVDEKKGIIRKNAPETEVGKQKLTEEEKRKNRPGWMTHIDPSSISRIPGNSYRNWDLPVSRSLFAVDTYRHGMDT